MEHSVCSVAQPCFSLLILLDWFGCNIVLPWFSPGDKSNCRIEALQASEKLQKAKTDGSTLSKSSLGNSNLWHRLSANSRAFTWRLFYCRTKQSMLKESKCIVWTRSQYLKYDHSIAFCVLVRVWGSPPVSVSILTWMRSQPWSRRRFSRGEAQPLHSGCADPCHYLKCR